MIRLTITRNDGRTRTLRFEDTEVGKASKALAEDSYFDSPDISEVVWQRLPDGPDVWPLPGYEQGAASASSGLRDYLERNPEELPAHEALLNEADRLRARLAAAELELAGWHAECDAVGIPHDPAGLVRHHRGNAGMAAAMQVMSESLGTEEENDRLRGSLEAAVGAPLRVACDGSSLDNPGFAGWGWYVDKNSWGCGGAQKATNNAMELTALLEFIKAAAHLPPETPIEAVLDSRYVIDTVTKWAPTWRWTGTAYLKRTGGEAVNSGLIREIMTLLEGRPGIRFHWVKGHRGDPLNEAADALATEQAKAHRAGRVLGNGPGLTIR